MIQTTRYEKMCSLAINFRFGMVRRVGRQTLYYLNHLEGLFCLPAPILKPHIDNP
jgi:hypothetical protein